MLVVLGALGGTACGGSARESGAPNSDGSAGAGGDSQCSNAKQGYADLIVMLLSAEDGTCTTDTDCTVLDAWSCGSATAVIVNSASSARLAGQLADYANQNCGACGFASAALATDVAPRPVCISGQCFPYPPL